MKIANYSDASACCALMRSQSLESAPLARAGARGAEIKLLERSAQSHTPQDFPSFATETS